MSTDDRAEDLKEWYAEDNPDGAAVLDAIADWFSRFIRVTDPDDLNLLTLWVAHTHMADALYTTPRLQLDSIMPGSGKTTVLDHMSRLCLNAIQAATLTSPALIPRLLEQGPATLLLDEVDRSLAPDRPGVGEMLGILNSGYRVGATRPVLVPQKGGGWEVEHMTTFAPVVLAGNAPNLPDDVRSRNLRILLMPDLDGSVEDSDWEHITGGVTQGDQPMVGHRPREGEGFGGEAAGGLHRPLTGEVASAQAGCRRRRRALAGYHRQVDRQKHRRGGRRTRSRIEGHAAGNGAAD